MTFTAGSPSPSEIAMESFMHQWKNGKMELYQRLAEAARDVCKVALEPKGLPGLVVYSRAKNPDSLQAKFEKYKREGKNFKTAEEIEKGMVDLAGARIIMHNKRDLIHAEAIIREHADEAKFVEHPGNSGAYKGEQFLYEATHWRVCLTQRDLHARGVGDACGKCVEIQVRTTAMEIVANIEHDVLYKSTEHPKFQDKQRFEMHGLQRLIWDFSLAQNSALADHRAAKNNACLEELNSVGYFVQKWIKDAKEGWFKDKEVKDFKPLWMYLRCEPGMTSRAGLNQILKTYLRPELESTYAEVSPQYMCDNLNLVVFIMDQVHLESNRNLDSAEPGHARKIEIIKSTMVWLDRISVSKLTWQCNFTHDRSWETLLDSLTWLQNYMPGRVVQGHLSLDPDEVEKLDWLWQWFEQHQTRPIRLAFAISKHGEPRGSRESQDIITPLIANLGVPIYDRSA